MSSRNWLFFCNVLNLGILKCQEVLKQILCLKTTTENKGEPSYMILGLWVAMLFKVQGSRYPPALNPWL